MNSGIVWLFFFLLINMIIVKTKVKIVGHTQRQSLLANINIVNIQLIHVHINNCFFFLSLH